MNPNRTLPVRPLYLTSLCLCVSVAHSSVRANDWPQWRGPGRSGIVTEKDLAATWPAAGPKETWRAPAGIGYGSPVGHGGRVYLFYTDGDNEILEAFDAATGKSHWKQSAATKYHAQYPGVRCTPVIDANRIYSYGASGELIARNLADGRALWTLDVLRETGTRFKMWGISSTPLIEGDRIYVQAGEGGPAAVAVNKADGKIAWKSQAQDGGYASPALATVDGKRQLLCFGHTTLVSMDPDTGRTLWTLDEQWETEWNINAALPIVEGNKVFLTVAYRNGHCGLYEISATGPKQLWGGKQVTGRFQPAILDAGHLYVNSEGTLKCVRWGDGNVVWSAKPNERNLLNMGGSIVRYGGDRLILLSDNGTLSLVKATPDGMERLASLRRFVEGDQIWATPLVYQGRLYIKAKDELIAYDIAAK